MKNYILILIGCMLWGLVMAQTEASKDEKQALESAENQVYRDEQAQMQAWKIEAAKGDLAAQYNMGIFYMYGYGVSKNEEEGIRLIRDAAEKGYPIAQNRLGEFYANSEGETNLAQAMEWWRLAAIQNEPTAQYNLGQGYQYGWAVEPNDSLAVVWYQQAADQSVSDAQFALSNCYMDGKGVPQDTQEALFWILVAFPNGWDEGYASIDNIARKVPKAEREIVKERARIWLSEHKAKDEKGR